MADALFESQVFRDKPVLWYRFNDASLATQARDSSGHGNHGEYSATGTSKLETVTATDAAVRFTSGKLIVPTNPSLNPAFFSIEALILWKGPNGHQQRILEKSTSSGGSQALYGLSILDDGRVRAEITSSGNFTLTSHQVLSPHHPVHIVATYDGVSLTIYINGALDATLAATGPLDSSGTVEDLAIGNQATRDRPLNGLLDEVVLYDHALTAGRIRAHTSAVRELNTGFAGGNVARRDPRRSLARRALGWGVAAPLIEPGDIGRDIVVMRRSRSEQLDLGCVEGGLNLGQDLAIALTTLVGADPFDAGFGFDGMAALTTEEMPRLVRERVRASVAKTVARDPRVRAITQVDVDNGGGAQQRVLMLRVVVDTVIADSTSLTARLTPVLRGGPLPVLEE